MYFNRAVWVILAVFRSLTFTHGFVCGPELVCDAGWTMSKTAPVCYLPVNVSMSWEFASLTCESVGASLIKIEDETENCEIRNYFQKFWIGLSRSAKNVSETVWNGKEVVSDREGIWDVNQPDTDDNKLKCVAANKNHLGRWSYEDCLTKMPFVCKKKSKLKGCFQCPNGDVMPPRQLCDDENDCGDNSDEMNCSSKCRYLHTGSSDDITYNPYEDKKTCQWKIVGPIGSTIKLMVKKGTSFEMNADFITIPQTLTNGLTGPITEDRIYYSRNNILRITLNSDNSQTGPFVASWLAENVVDNWKLTATTTVKKLTLNSLPYKQYEWIITAENKNVITLQFESVTLDKSSGSFLKFFDGDQPVSVNYNPGEIYVSRSKSMRIVLVSYSASNQLSVSYNQGCTITASSQQTFNIASPGFQENNNYGYPNDVYCEWNISALSNYPASIKFSEFDLKLNSDYLAIKNITADLHLGSGFSGDGGKIKETVFRSTDGYFMLGFTSDMALTAKGFQAQYSIDCKLASSLSQWTETEPILEEYTPFDTEITVTCMTGYQFKQEEYNSYSSVGVNCMKGGSWNVTKFPDCEISHCGTPPAIDYGYILSSTGVTYNNTATYKCDEGFTIDKNTIKCQADGKWETKPKCTASGCTARALTPNLNYTIIDGGFEKYGNVLQFFCEPGYQIIGSLRIYCKTKEWSHDSPMCKEITCPIPMVIEGSVKSDSGILFGKMATLECNSGYNVNGTNSNTQQLMCGTDGTFNDPQGEKSELLCTDIDECENGSSLNTCKGNQTCVNNLGGFTCPCKEGYKPDPDPNKDCINIDECQENNGGCGHTCKDETPGYSCTCLTGYELYMYDGFNNISLAEGEDGKNEGDVYYINHTCVRKQCPQPVSPKDGVVLSQKQLFYFEDTVKYKCNHGYKMNTSSPLRTCGFDGKWNSEPPGCEVATCKTQLKSSNNNINRVIPGDGEEINYGEESIIECKYGTTFINRTQYCSYNGSDTYDLLGDSSGCPVIDCGQPVVIPGSSYTMPRKTTTYGESFTFSCQTGFKEEGISTQGTMKVTCEENGRWGMGNLTCTGDMCVDPGTPGGAYQVVTSYEVGELLYFQCKRTGYQPVPPEPFLCQIESGNVKWNNTQLPACKDVTDPVFSNCPSTIIYVDYMEQVSYTIPTATDNSDVVKNTSVSPAYMKPNTVIKQDTNVTYYAEDYAGNRAMCSIQIKIKQRQVPTLQCVSGPVAVKIQNSSFVNSLIPQESLVSSVSNPSNLTIPSLIPFNSLSNPPKEIKITAMDTYGTTTSCSVLSFSLASACFEEIFPTTPFSQRICTPGTNDSLACNVTCGTGYIFYDGKQSQTYQCEMAESPQPYQLVTWTPRSSPNYCLRYSEPAYRVEINVTYSVSGALAYKCIADHETKLKSKEFRDALATQLKNICSAILTANNNIEVEDTIITATVGFTMTSKLVSVIPSGNKPFETTFCTDTITFKLQSGTLNSYLGSNSALNCTELTASTSVTSAIVSSRGNLCSSGTIEKKTDLGTKCVPCPPGSYFTSDSCVDCPEGQYQDVAGQLQCKMCGAGKGPSGDQTTCIDLCPKGFINDTIGQVPFCVPCLEDTYWLNSTNCQPCPTGYKTFSTAAKSESDCKAPCGEGNYSTTGYEPCMPCPVNYYQDKTGQKTCAACKTNEITENTGTSNSSFCIDQTSVWCNASQTQCSGNGDCSVIGHMKYCACKDGYKGDNCENEDNPCDANPCFNGGNCIKTGVDTYNCSCLIDDTCRMVRETGNWFGTDKDDYITLVFSSLEACEKACIDNTRCKTVAYTAGSCSFYGVNTVAVPYSTTSTLSRKVCDFTVLFTGDQCETDAVNSCTNNTECGNYGMCQDGLGTVVDGKINPISSFKCLCQKEGEFEEGNRCKRKQDLCSPNPCENNGKCVQFGDIRRHCECLPGYSGDNCSKNIDECKIHPNGCLYDGECKDGVNSYTCTCKTGFGGDNCQTAANLCTLDPRCTNGLCYNNYDNYTAVCVCEKPYQLATNGKCVLMDPCMGVTCQNGTCKNGKCECQTGYEGSQCQHDIDDCKNEPCKNGAQCIDKYNSFECKCKSGYEGALCDQNVDDCVGSCENSTTVSCQDKVADFECICMKGYTGKNCSEEINECDSYPCKHESECIDQVGDYKCNCSAGWTGKDCGTPVDYCKNNPCQNGGNCHNLIDGYFCRCKPGTRGDNCDIFPKVCSVTIPCTSNGACWDTDGTAKCNCTDNYTGVSCNLIKDSCEEKVCKNGGTCQTKDLGFQCLCPGGYSGPTCEVYTDPCSGSSKCHSTAMCKSEYDKYLCLCAQGKTLTGSGCKATFEDWDMFFDSKIGRHGALSLTPFMLGTSEYTVTFWTRFKVNDDQPEPVLIRMLVSSIAKPLYYPIDVEDLSKLTIFKVTNDSVYTSNGTEETTVKLEDGINDGKWHHVGVISKSSGELEMSVDGVRQISTGVQSTTLPKYIQLLIGQNLNGRLSRVTMWQTALSYVDIVKAADPNYKPTGTIAQGWTNYMLSEGSERRYPSKVKQTVCDLGLEDATCNNKYKDKPEVVKCPSDKEQYSSTRLTKVDDLLLETDIEFSSNYSLKVRENFPSDRYFGYGAKSYYAFAIDEYGNSAECTVRVVVKRSTSCIITNNGDYKEPIYCDGGSSGGSICDLQCQDDTLLLSQPVPKIFKCGNLGTYYTESVCENKPYNQGVKDFVLPSCGGRGAMKRRIEVKLQYRFQVSCTSSFLLSLENDIGTTFNSQISDWRGICPIGSLVCSTVFVTATCSTTQSAIADVLIKVSDLSDAVSKGGSKYTPIEAFRVLVFIERKFSYPNIGASVLVNETVLIEEFKSCGPGYAIVGQNCVQCPAGSYYDSSTYSCKFCDIGYYQNQAGQPSCISCGGTKTTLEMGSSKTSDCVEKCLPGTYYEIGKSKCEQCPIHHYQDEEGKTYCLGCPVGKKTSGTGSNSSSDCYDDCIAGTELKLDGSCQSCPRGYYRSLQQDKCEKCKNSSYTTKSNGTKSEDFCDIRICYAGTYRNASINECQDCPVGEYQPEDLQDSCKSCDPSYSTKDKGSVNETSCIFYCNPGEEVESASAKKCRKCDRGKYKDNSGNTKFDMCMPCPEGNTTVGIGSTSLADCIITYCSAGTFRNTATNQCENCTRGQYTDKDLQEKCESCENNYFTRNEGSDNKTDCEYHCDPGKQLKDAASKLCEPCPRGFYRDNKVGFYFELCQACPEGNTTIFEQSTSVNNCSILNCTMGQLINFYGGCDNCPVDTFQPDDSPTTSTKCQDCPSGTATKQEGSSIQSQCEPFCIAGKQYNNVSKQCEPCPKGTYNDGNDTMKFDSCMQCPENYTTPGSGSISVARCSLLDCDPGYKISGESCQPCGFGFYNSKRHQTECLKCTTKDTNTSTETSTNATDCQLHCPPGKSGSISCETCKDGFIKPNAGLDDCGECLGNYTSNANRTACDKLFCDKGYYYNATGPTCLPCDKGSYKDYKGNHGSCTSCDPGWTTAEKAANDKSKCDQKFCIKGKEYNSSIDQCVSCAVGYFKDTIGNDPCKPCWTNLTTTDVGSTDVSQCSIIVCEAGQKRTDPNTCVNCAIGTYQKDRGQTSCTNCGIGKTTMSDTSKSETDCVPLCKAGEEYNAGTKTCSECDFGHFKTNASNDVSCITCPQALKTTKTKGSTSVKQCTEDICGAGTKRVSNQGCVPCPRGQYQHQQEKTECFSCSSNQTTVNSGSTSSEACIVDCPDGKSYNYFSKTCSNCDIGWYTNKTKHCCKCIQCPDDKKVTAYAGSNICIQSTVITPAPRGKRMLKFSYTFRITLECKNEDVRMAFVEEFKRILRRRLILLSVTYITLCKDPECTTRMGTLRIPSVNCHGKRYKRSTAGNVIFNVEIPDVEETVKDSSGTGVKTNDLLVEDFNANKDAYKEQQGNFEPEEISQGEFVKICNTGDVLDTTSNTCKPCPKGTFFNSTLSICVGCQKNTYQDQEAQSTCKSCTGIKKHTINVNSTSASDCVSECAVNSGYCQNGGTCNSDDFSIFCTCTERYQGTLCQNFKQPVSNTEAIIGGAVGGGAALLLIILLIVGICVYFRTPRDTHYQDKRRQVYDIDDDLYRNPLYDNRSNAMFPPQMNRSFVMDDFSGDDAVYNPYSKNPGRPTGIDEDHSEFRWKPTS